MYEIFISTYNEKILIGLLKDDQLIDIKENITTRSHSVFLVPMIEEIILTNNITLQDLKEIIVVNGPGSFTGIRLGITVAKMLAYTLNIRLKEITSIEAIAYSIEEKDKIVEISDSKGKYIGIFNNNKLIDEIIYLRNDSVEKYLEKYNYNRYIDNEISLNKVVTFFNELDTVNPHSSKPIYIKEIEALSDK